MNHVSPITLLMAAVLLAGCETAPQYAQHPGPYVKPGLILVPADQYKYYEGATDQGTAPPPGWSTTDAQSVQTEAQVSAVQYNRYTDPNNQELMHEAHIVYRRENPPAWKLQPGTAVQQILVGPQATEGRSELKPVQSQELEGYLRDQRISMARQQQVMGSVSEGMRQLAQQQQELAKEIAQLKADKQEQQDHEPSGSATRPEIPGQTSDAEQVTPKSGQ